MPNCKFEGCGTRASYGTEHKKALRCSKHKTEEMYLVTTKLCLECKKYPHYNFPGETKGIYCKTHCKENMKVVATHCAAENCINNAVYNYKNMKRMFCSIHKTEDMVEAGKPICNNEKCLTVAIYGLSGGKPIRCKTHMENNMIDLFHKTCIFEGCKSRPSYNLPGEKTPLYCSEHSSENMEDNAHSKCITKGCKKIPTFNYDGLQKRLYCVEHAIEGMVNITARFCISENCKNNPRYNYIDKTERLYCNEHFLEGMINISHKCCEFESCRIRPCFNICSETKGRFCGNHKLKGMIDVINDRCENEGCNISPIYNYRGEKKRRFCGSHYLPGMINISKTNCKTPMCETTAQKKYEGHCLRCFIHLHPDKPNARNYKTKERTVVDIVLAAFPSFTWVTDKKVSDGCSRRRPDLFLDMGSHVIIVEVDENQHTDYDCSCENKRLMEISQDVGHRPIIFIRFNPDDYTDQSGVKFKSCFAADKSAIFKVAKSKVGDWNMRTNALLQQIAYWSETPTTKTVEVVQLFYDADN